MIDKKVKHNKYYGKINFLSCSGVVGETIYYKDKESFDKEKSDSINCGRPITCEVFKKQKLLKKKNNESEKTREQCIIVERKKDQQQKKEREER